MVLLSFVYERDYFPYLPPVTPEKIYIEYVKEKGIYEVITDDAERITRLRGKTLRKESQL